MDNLILADDLTGALDSGVELKDYGVHVVADMAGLQGDIAKENTLVVNLESRHLCPDDAYARVRQVLRRLQPKRVYKKTDSALRGNVEAELRAVADEMQSGLCFVPAFPAMGRTTQGGIHRVDGVPVAESVFGRDPFTPVTQSNVLALTKALSPVLVGVEDCVEITPAKSYVFDAWEQAHLQRIAAMLTDTSMPLAGCAAFARFLPELMHLQRQARPALRLPGRLCAVSGSLNPITDAQIERAKEGGARLLELDAALPQDGAKLCILQSPRNPKDTGEAARKAMAARLGQRAAQILQTQPDTLLMVIGGDSLQGLMQALGCQVLRPVYSPAAGVVIGLIDHGGRWLPIVTKSGGLGPVNTFEILTTLCGKEIP